MGEDNNIHLSLSLPLDSDGFLRRECPTCEGEFKWFHGSEGDDVATVPDSGYFCPYCGVQAPTNGWLTKAQVELAHNSVATEALGPLIEGTGLKYTPPATMDPLTEIDDMTRVDFLCHPGEPVKVREEWRRLIYCLICGTASSN